MQAQALTADRAPAPETGPCATGYIIVSWTNGRPQHGTTYYADEADAAKDARWYAARFLGTAYEVEAVQTARCGLHYGSRIPELEAAAKSQRTARDRAALISKLVRQGKPYGDAIVAAQTRFPFGARA